MNVVSMLTARKHIVVLGGGFAGLRAARDLAQGLRKLGLTDRYEVVMIDRNGRHTFTPLLYEAATTSHSSASCDAIRSLVDFPLEELLSPLGVPVITAEVTHIDAHARTVRLGARELSYDYLLVSLGAEPDFFGIPGVDRFALTLASLEDAERIRNTFMELWSARTHFDVVIAGAGPTGVELAGELAAWADELRRENDESPEVHFHLIDRGPRILGMFEERVSQAAARRLKALGVELWTGISLEHAEADAVMLGTKETLSADLLLWTGGVRGSRRGDSLPFRHDDRGRIAVDQTLRAADAATPFLERVYLAGDLAGLPHPVSGAPVPQTAPNAVREGARAAANILAEIAKETGVDERAARRPIRLPKQYPYIIPVGGKYAVAKLGPFVITGFVAWIFKGLVELRYFLSIMPPGRALRLWYCGLKLFLSSKRLG